MKIVMMNKWFVLTLLTLLILLILLILIGCNKEENNRSDRHNPSYTEEIQSLEVVSFGGKFGVYSSTLVNKNSIYYSHKINTEPHHLKFSHKIKIEDWADILNKIDLKAFRNVREGKSMQPIDGIDTKIIIISNRDTVSKTNAYDNAAWKNIIDNINQYKKE